MNDGVVGALARLRSESESTRLEAARELRKNASSLSAEAQVEVGAAFAKEDVPWVRGVLAEILALGVGELEEPTSIAAPRWDEQIEGADPEVARQAVNVSTNRVLHEVAAVVGRARVAAAEDFAEFRGSETERQLQFLSDVCDGLRVLASATGNPQVEEFDLRAELIALADRVSGSLEIPVPIRVEGPGPVFMVRSDRTLLDLTIRNLLANAAEATESLGTPEERAVTITWGISGDSIQISIIDRGPGPPPFLATRSRVGVSTKVGHPGYGLATASEAMRSLGGEVFIRRNDRGGATALIRWPEEPSE